MIPATYWSPTKKLMVLGAMAGGKLVEDTATGNPLTFITDKEKPLKSLLIPFTPQQEGTGDPSPSNIRSILPWNGLTVKNGGKNLLNPAWLNFEGQSVTNHGVTFTKNADGSITANGTADGGAQVYFNVTSQFDGNYYICDDQLIGSDIDIFAYNSTAGQRVRKWDGTSQSDAVTSARRKAEVKLNSGDTISINLRVYSGRTVNNVTFKPMLVGGTETDFTYELFKPITDTDIVFPSPVYGGTLDMVSGVLTVEWAGFSATWGDGESATDMGSGITRKVFPMVDYLTTGLANNMCNIAPYQASENATVHFYYSGSGATNRKCRLFLPSDTPDTTAVTVVTKLSQTYEVQLTPTQLTALIGNNTIWSDADGSMTAVYLKKG